MTVSDLFNRNKKHDPEKLGQDLLFELKMLNTTLLTGDKRDTKKLRALIKAGANLEAKNADGETPLIYAAGRRMLECINILIDAKADIEAKAKNGDTPLIAAQTSVSGPLRDACVQALLDAGADPNERDRDGNTPLMLAAQFGNTHYLKALIAAGAEINLTNENNVTALMTAACEGKTECLEALIAAEAYLEIRDINNGYTALAWALSSRHPDCIKALVAAGANHEKGVLPCDTMLHSAARAGYAECVQAFIDTGIRFDGLNEDDQTPLDVAEEKNRTEVIHILKEVLKEAEAAAEKQFMEDTDFSKGLEKPMVATKPLLPKMRPAWQY